MTSLESPSCHQATAELLALFHLCLADRATGAPESSKDVLSFLDDGAHLLRICRNCVVPAFDVLVQREVLFDDARANCNCGEWDCRAQRVIAEAHGAFKRALQHLDIAKMNGLVLGRI